MPALPLRIPDDLAATVDAWAQARGLSRNAALVALIRAGLGGEGGAAPAPAAPPRAPSPPKPKAQARRVKAEDAPKVRAARDALATAEAKAAHLGRKADKAQRRAWGETMGIDLQVGPTRPEPGGRLKQDRRALRPR